MKNKRKEYAMKFGYVRVSSEYQNKARQIAQLKKYLLFLKLDICLNSNI